MLMLLRLTHIHMFYLPSKHTFRFHLPLFARRYG